MYVLIVLLESIQTSIVMVHHIPQAVLIAQLVNTKLKQLHQDVLDAPQGN